MRIGHNKKSGITSGNCRDPHPSGFVLPQMRAFKHSSASVGVDSPCMLITSLLQVQKSLRWSKETYEGYPEMAQKVIEGDVVA